MLAVLKQEAEGYGPMIIVSKKTYDKEKIKMAEGTLGTLMHMD